MVLFGVGQAGTSQRRQWCHHKYTGLARSQSKFNPGLRRKGELKENAVSRKAPAWVERTTDKPGAKMMWVRVCSTGFFLPASTFSADSLKVSVE